MGMRRVIFILILLSVIQLSMPVPLRGQQFLWDVDLKFGFDNREYSSLTTSPSGTIFGTVLSPKVGLGFGDGHAVYAGVDITRYFGKSDRQCGGFPQKTYDRLLSGGVLR